MGVKGGRGRWNEDEMERVRKTGERGRWEGGTGEEKMGGTWHEDLRERKIYWDEGKKDGERMKVLERVHASWKIWQQFSSACMF